MKRFSAILYSKYILYIVIAMFATAVFCYIYGYYILNPVYTDWLLADAHYDLSQHYLGWVAYRQSEWTFPIGYTDYLAYPTQTSVIFTDSIPCFAVLFKLLSPVLPDEFQYFGLWGLLCFILQGVLSARIISRFTDNKAIIVCTGIFFVFIPAVIRKMFGHTALAGQWIILLALDRIFDHESYATRKKYIAWMLIGGLAVSIHMYFVVMCGIILIGYCVADSIINRRVRDGALLLLLYLLSVGIVIAILGGFSKGPVVTTDGLGIFSLNLNGLFNSQGWSCLIPSFPLLEGQFEGFIYLGVGGILLLLVAVIQILLRKKIRVTALGKQPVFVAMLLISFLTFIFALSPTVTLNDRVIVQVPLPEFLLKCWSIFRSTGRIGWVLVYIILLSSLFVLCKTFNNRTAFIFLFICTAIQVYDIHRELFDRHIRYSQKVEYETVFRDAYAGEKWSQLGNNDEIKHIVFTQTVTGADLYAFTDWALSHGKTVSNFYFARPIDEEINVNLRKALLEPSCEEMFIFFPSNVKECARYDLNYYIIGNNIIGYRDVIDGMDLLPDNYFYNNLNQ